MAGVKFSSVLFLILILTIMGWMMQSLLMPRASAIRTDGGRNTAAVQGENIATETSADMASKTAG